jgi:tetratricopeptide (TPR) repeat protein
MKTRLATSQFCRSVAVKQAVSLLLFVMAIPLAAAPIWQEQLNTAPIQRSNSPVRIDGYDIDLVLDPVHQSMQARVRVNLTALRSADSVSFELNPALRVTAITDESGQRLSAERTSPSVLGSSLDANLVQVAPGTPIAKGQHVAWTFTYDGVFQPSSQEVASTASAQPALLASIGDPVSYLLYAARWFPIVNDGNRFAATIHVHLPAGECVFGSGAIGAPRTSSDDSIFDFEWNTPGFPGTIVAGKFGGPYTTASAPNVRVYLIDSPLDNNAAQRGAKLAATASQAYRNLITQFGPLPSEELNVIELPAATVPASSAPELAAISARYLQGDDPSRLLANTIAHQWWGGIVSAANRNDKWITNGMSRYAELEYLQTTASKATFADAVFNVSASALAYDSIPMNGIGRYGDFSPQFQSMTYDKGAMIFRMLRWQIGDAAFHQFTRQILSQFAEKKISSADVESIAESVSHQNLRPFFTQWLDSTGAPSLTEKWTLYRLGDKRGFRTIGEVDQDLDLFQIPVDVRAEVNGDTINRRVQASGASTQFIVDTASIPHAITLDPDRWLLRNSHNLQVRVHILRGINLAADGNEAGAIQEYGHALAIDRLSSLASYRLGETYFGERNYQAAADAFRAALDGDGTPKWTEVWSDVQLGKTFDASGQRDRAVSQYREAIATQDNTGGALDLAREYLQRPYTPVR